MSTQAGVPERGTALDGLKPRDFARDPNAWPTSPLHIPAELRGRGLTTEQLHAHVGAMEELRQLALAYVTYIGRSGKSNQDVAQRLGVSLGALRNLRSGAALPSARTLLLLQYLIPSPEQMEVSDYRDSLTRRQDKLAQREGRTPPSR
ncbi:hypothetical protein GCM10009867_17060 [Pedococcus aerophilus]|uniref:HTH cro/C1-type domain-containing protein n=1 Tax=Pedococcus aerophilus TaxID=436356 RepID=A0ABN3ULN6_9MICO